MAKVELKNIIWKEGKDYVSWNLNTGISSFGATKKEALSALKEALELYFEDEPIAKINKVEKINFASLSFEYA